MARMWSAMILVLAVVVLGGAVSVATASPVAAQDQAIAQIQIEQLRTSSGAEVVPVRVTITSARAIEATLRLRTSDSSAGWEVPYALAANSVVEQVFVVPTTVRDLQLEAELVSSGDVIAEADLDDDARAAFNAIAVLGVEAPAEVPVVPALGVASVTDLDDIRLLPALDSVVAAPQGLRSLTSEELSTLLRWVGVGGQLVVVGEPGAIDELLPAPWRDDAGHVLADAGVLRYVGPDWAERGVEAGGRIAVHPNALRFFDQSNQPLLNDAGFRFPGIGVISILLVVYLLVAGPIAFAVLARMKRSTLAWGVIPALAVVFTAGVFIAGAIVTAGRGNGHATIIEVTSGGAWATETVLIAESGTRTVTLPNGWSPLNGSFSFVEDSGAPLTFRPDRDSTDVVFEIDTGSAGSAIVTGPAGQYDEALAITIAATSVDSISGTVTNRSGADLVETVAMIGGNLTELGDLGDGQTVDWEIDLTGLARAQLPELRRWNVEDFNDFGFNNRAELRDGPINGASWIEFRSTAVGTAAPNGLVTIVGWTRDAEGITNGGTGRTAFVVRSPIPAIGDVSAASIRQFTHQAPASNFGDFGPIDFGAGSIIVTSHVRPEGADTTDIGFDMRADVSQIRVWVNDEWRALDVGADGRQVVRVPADAWDGDELRAEYTIAEFFGEPGQVDRRLVSAGVTALDAELLPAGERSDREAFFDGGVMEEEFFEGGESEIGADTVVEFEVGETFDAEGFLENSHDLWRIELTEGQEVRVGMFADGGAFGGGQLDPELIVRGPDGQQVAQNDDFRNCCDSRVDFRADTDGEYVIETRQLGGFGGFGSYTVTIEVEGGDE